MNLVRLENVKERRSKDPRVVASRSRKEGARALTESRLQWGHEKFRTVAIHPIDKELIYFRSTALKHNASSPKLLISGS